MTVINYNLNWQPGKANSEFLAAYAVNFSSDPTWRFQLQGSYNGRQVSARSLYVNNKLNNSLVTVDCNNGQLTRQVPPYGELWLTVDTYSLIVVSAIGGTTNVEFHNKAKGDFIFQRVDSITEVVQSAGGVGTVGGDLITIDLIGRYQPATASPLSANNTTVNLGAGSAFPVAPIAINSASWNMAIDSDNCLISVDNGGGAVPGQLWRANNAGINQVAVLGAYVAANFPYPIAATETWVTLWQQSSQTLETFNRSTLTFSFSFGYGANASDVIFTPTRGPFTVFNGTFTDNILVARRDTTQPNKVIIDAMAKVGGVQLVTPLASYDYLNPYWAKSGANPRSVNYLSTGGPDSLDAVYSVALYDGTAFRLSAFKRGDYTYPAGFGTDISVLSAVVNPWRRCRALDPLVLSDSLFYVVKLGASTHFTYAVQRDGTYVNDDLSGNTGLIVCAKTKDGGAIAATLSGTTLIAAKYNGRGIRTNYASLTVASSILVDIFPLPGNNGDIYFGLLVTVAGVANVIVINDSLQIMTAAPISLGGGASAMCRVTNVDFSYSPSTSTTVTTKKLDFAKSIFGVYKDGGAIQISGYSAINQNFPGANAFDQNAATPIGNKGVIFNQGAQLLGLTP